MRLTPRQIEMLMHATGWNHRSNPLYRNRYTPGASDLPDIQRLVAKRLMRMSHAPAPSLSGDDNGTYAVTDDGLAHLIKYERKRNAEARRLLVAALKTKAAKETK